MRRVAGDQDCTSFAGLARRFRADDRGAAAAVFAIVFSMVLLAAAMAIEYAVATAEVTREQYALDAAALAASDKLGLPDQDTQGPAIAKAFFKANLNDRSNAEIQSVTFDAAAGEVKARSQGTIAATLMKAFGASDIKVGASTTVAKGDQMFEIALVLDNSGSMAGTYIADLKTAAKNLTATLFAGAEGNGKVSIGVVPFAASVNVGSSMRGADWLDEDGVSSIHYENIPQGLGTRYQLFDAMGVSWRGCVEVRPGAYATNDTAPTSAEPDTYFVPMFAPDEPDSNNSGGNSYSNSYLADDAGGCPTQPTVCTRYSNRTGNCLQSAKVALNPQCAQKRTTANCGTAACNKYQGQSPSNGSGPNASCTTRPILPLTTTQGSVESHIDSLTASGNTNIGEGFMWGWRVLSPGAPFTEGRDYGTPKNNKVVILMTDGQNTYSTSSNHNRSTYGAYGYAANNRLGNSYSGSALVSSMNTNLTTACANAKAAGITIYTIAFRLENDPTTQNLLSTCATSQTKYFAASNGTALIGAFQQIAKQLNQLRVAG